MCCHAVKRTEQYGHVIFLRLMDDQCNSLLPVYIGEQLQLLCECIMPNEIRDTAHQTTVNTSL